MTSEIDVTKPPYGADPTGKEDSTQAIINALDEITGKTRLAYLQGLSEVERLPPTGKHYHPDGVENHRENGEVRCVCCARIPYVPTLFFPEGEYKVSDTLCYRREDLFNTYGSTMNQQIRIRGAGVGKTTIRLIDGAKGYGPGERKALISFMPGKKSNVAMSNYCEDLSLNCGSGNPGVTGLDFFANNSGAVRNIRVFSEDGMGYAGVVLGHDAFSGILVKHVEVDGMDHGIYVNSESGSMFAHIEELTTRNQKRSGVEVGAISLSIRKLRTENVPIGVRSTENVGFLALVDSVLEGEGPSAIVREKGVIYVSDVETRGFENARHIDEVVMSDSEWEIQSEGMNRLPIEETPMVPRFSRSVGVKEYGAIGNGINDDSDAIQRALFAGVKGVRFEPGRYLINKPIEIPSEVERVNFDFCDLVAGLDLKKSNQEGFVIKGREEDPPLLIERLFAFEQWCGEHTTFTHVSKRTVCFRDLHTQTLSFYRNTTPGAKVFFDNVATTTGVIPGTENHGRCPIILRGQKVWARQLNPERGEPMILNEGSELVLMGYKSEGTGVVVETTQGGRTEILGGVINIGKTGDLAFLTRNAELRVSTASHGWREPAFHRVAVSEEIEGREVTRIESSEMPRRGFDESRGPQYVIPLFKSDIKKQQEKC